MELTAGSNGGIESYLAQARDAGCAEEQMRNFLRAEILLQPKQLAASAAARACDLPDGPTALGYGGARGGCPVETQSGDLLH